MNFKQCRNILSLKKKFFTRTYQFSVTCIICASYYYFSTHNVKLIKNVNAKTHLKKIHQKKTTKLTSREKRFIEFASVEYDGQCYMTPMNFLESIIKSKPIRKVKRKILKTEDLNTIRATTPLLIVNNNVELFHDLKDSGIISYTEYLFLLSILLKPHCGFQVAFNMFDTDGDKKIDKNEFLMMKTIFNNVQKHKQRVNQKLINDNTCFQHKHDIDTTLLIHLFGPEGNLKLNFKNFKQFLVNFQREVLRLEFDVYSKNHETISEIDFAKILLRFTKLHTEDYEIYLINFRKKKNDNKGITFKEFYGFYQFLNNLEDFAIVMRFYMLADTKIKQDEFRRAAKICSGVDLSQNVIKVVFALFDINDDGTLNNREFIFIMKDRLHREHKMCIKRQGWDAFKTCIKHETKYYL